MKVKKNNHLVKIRIRGAGCRCAYRHNGGFLSMISPLIMSGVKSLAKHAGKKLTKSALKKAARHVGQRVKDSAKKELTKQANNLRSQAIDYGKTRGKKVISDLNKGVSLQEIAKEEQKEITKKVKQVKNQVQPTLKKSVMRVKKEVQDDLKRDMKNLALKETNISPMNQTILSNILAGSGVKQHSVQHTGSGIRFV